MDQALIDFWNIVEVWAEKNARQPTIQVVCETTTTPLHEEYFTGIVENYSRGQFIQFKNAVSGGERNLELNNIEVRVGSIERLNEVRRFVIAWNGGRIGIC